MQLVLKCTSRRLLLYESNADAGAELHFFGLQENSTAKDAHTLAKV